MCHHDHRPPTIFFKDKWKCDLDSDVARSSKKHPTNRTRTQYQFSSTGRFVTKWSEETLERTKFDRDTLNQEKHDNVTDPASTGRPVVGQESTKVEELDIDFRVPGLSHTVVKEAEHFQVQELVKRSKIILIEKHPTCSRITSTTQSAKI